MTDWKALGRELIEAERRVLEAQAAVQAASMDSVAKHHYKAAMRKRRLANMMMRRAARAALQAVEEAGRDR